MKAIVSYIFVMLLLLMTSRSEGQRLQVEEPLVSFVSEAPLEIINASTKELAGLVDLDSRTFAFQINIKSFKGFNSQLQQEHFYENYLESDKFPKASYVGKLIDTFPEEIGVLKTVRSKGKLIIHGVEREEIVLCEVIKTSDGYTVVANMELQLEDYNIDIPVVVYQKIAEIISVQIEFKLSH